MKLYTKQFLIVLFLHAFLSLTTCVCAQEDILNINVSIEASDATIPELLKEIEKHPAIQFIYPHNVLPKNYKVNINVHNHELHRVLRSVLGTTNLGWQELDGMIVFHKLEKEDLPPGLIKEMTNQINVINVYDTIVSVQYDTVTNYVYDTLMVIQHDTVVHDVYNYKKPVENRLTLSFAYDQDLYNDNPNNLLEQTNEYYYSAEQYGSTRAIYTLLNYKRNKLYAESGLGIRPSIFNTRYAFPEYHPITKDTTVYVYDEIEEFRVEGGDTVHYFQPIWYDSSYTFVCDSAVEQHTRNSKQTINYLSIPLSLGYQVYSTNKFIFFIYAGGKVDILLNSKRDDITLSVEYDATIYKKFLYSYYVGLMCQYSLTQKVNLWTAVYYRRQSSDRYRATIHDENYVYDLSCRFGLGYIIL